MFLEKIYELSQNESSLFVGFGWDSFRWSDHEADASGGGEKVKEAVSKSLEKSKATVEDTAKSAARIAGETVHKTKEKMKKILSAGKGSEQSQPDEL